MNASPAPKRANEPGDGIVYSIVSTGRSTAEASRVMNRFAFPDPAFGAYKIHPKLLVGFARNPCASLTSCEDPHVNRPGVLPTPSVALAVGTKSPPGVFHRIGLVQLWNRDTHVASPGADRSPLPPDESPARLVDSPQLFVNRCIPIFRLPPAPRDSVSVISTRVIVAPTGTADATSYRTSARRPPTPPDCRVIPTNIAIPEPLLRSPVSL